MVRKKAPSTTRRSVIGKHQRSFSPGLGVLDTVQVRKAVEEQHIINIFKRLQSDLIKLEARRKSLQPPRRCDALDLLAVIQTALADLTDQMHGQSGILIASRSSTLLQSLIGQLSDLDYGRVGELMRPTEGVAGAAYKFEEKRIREMALVLVRCLREKGFSLRTACKRVSSELGKLEMKFRGEDISDKRIYSWWKNTTK
ncbi:hypothetical protein [Aestuariivirga sp.]|uniref:hypothetical protein n=1 Tax=Aestuariivirga sp. TaxID=2650926 RepID=UPI0037837355